MGVLARCAGQVWWLVPPPDLARPAPTPTAWPGQPPAVFFRQRVTPLGQPVPKRKKLEIDQAHLVTLVFN